MSHQRGDDLAFPVFVSWGEGEQRLHPGMTMREYFAGIALQGLLARGAVTEFSEGWEKDPACKARQAFRYADAMLAEAEKRGGAAS